MSTQANFTVGSVTVTPGILNALEYLQNPKERLRAIEDFESEAYSCQYFSLDDNREGIEILSLIKRMILDFV